MIRLRELGDAYAQASDRSPFGGPATPVLAQLMTGDPEEPGAGILLGPASETLTCKEGLSEGLGSEIEGKLRIKDASRKERQDSLRVSFV
jgi:hypothetical protein